MTVKITQQTLDIGADPVAPAANGTALSRPGEARVAFDGANIVQSVNGAAYAPVTTAAPVFGQDFQGASERVRTTTTSTTFQTKVALTTPVLTGDYYYFWQALVDQSSTTSQIEIRLWNVDAGFSQGQWQLVQPTNTIERIFTGGQGGFSLAASSVTFEIQWRALGGNTAGIEDALITIYRVG